MNFVIKNSSGENIVNLARKIGYIFRAENKEKSELTFIRPLEKSGYPRFHLYIKTGKENNELIFNLHLDQKRPIYRGSPAHSGEYEGGVVEKESERIKNFLKKPRK